MKSRFYKCNHCGNIIGLINDSGVPVVCCGEKMANLVPGSVDASVEKHLPVCSIEGDKLTVTVGSVIHPQTSEHNISWIYIQTENGGQRKNLALDSEPVTTFALNGEKVIAVYAYCNLHGLWKTDIE